MGLVALAGNTWAFALLWRHRSDDINMTSTWLCSRNDLIANAAVLAAAAAVWQLDSVWPDVIVGAAIAALFLRTARDVIHDARAELAKADDDLNARHGLTAFCQGSSPSWTATVRARHCGIAQDAERSSLRRVS
jgi:Co/Zn/Cd efflux system component